MRLGIQLKIQFVARSPTAKRALRQAMDEKEKIYKHAA
jgi:hypothetical protein